MKVDILICGFLKCGMEKLTKHYKYLDPSLKIYNDQFITKPNAREYFDNFGWDECPQITVITRDPVDRCWSAYNYFRDTKHPHVEGLTYEEYLYHKRYHSSWGETNPIYQSNYERHIKPFRDLNIVVIKLEDLIGAKPPYTTISDFDRKLTEKLLEKEIADPMTPSESPDDL
jgi:hypothetical protein